MNGGVPWATMTNLSLKETKYLVAVLDSLYDMGEGDPRDVAICEGIVTKLKAKLKWHERKNANA